MAEPRVSPQAATSPIFRIKGQRSRWRYPDARVSAEYCQVLRDVNISERGTAESRYGYATYNSTQLAGGEAVVGLWEGTFADVTVRRVVVTPTKIYHDDGTTRTDVTGDALTAGNDDRCQFAFLKDTLLINNGVDQIQTWDGDYTTPAAAADLTGVLWTAAKGMFVHKNLLLVYGTTESGTYYPTRIRFCDINRSTYVVDITRWLDANRYEVYDGGPAIVGAVDAWGKALIFKEDGLYPGEIVYGQTGYYDFQLGKPVRGFSPVSRHGIVARPEFVAGPAKEGVFVVMPSETEGGFDYRIATVDNTDEWLSLNQDRLVYSQAFIREKDHQVRWLMSSASNTSGHDRVLVFDWDSGDVWLDRPVHNMNFAATVHISGDELDWLGAEDGFIYKGNDSSYTSDNGTGYSWQIRMHPNDLGLPGKMKHILNVKTIFRKRAGASSVNVSVTIDQGRSRTVRGTITTGTSYKWNSGLTWNSGLRWPGAPVRIGDTYVNRICETIAPEWYGNTPASIEGYQVEFIPLEP